MALYFNNLRSQWRLGTWRMLSTIISTTEAQALEEASRRIFGNLPVLGKKTGAKVARSKMKGPILDAYYPPPLVPFIRKEFPWYKTGVEERRAARRERLTKRGHAPPKKGEGKRSKKK
mmetsp:Transcript_17019/g.24881  ORF Transcript_17019/g.24881 Transcript_17019/m.24881 type:complete len:118 (-) Transcript_17019:35-388(-)